MPVQGVTNLAGNPYFFSFLWLLLFSAWTRIKTCLTTWARYRGNCLPRDTHVTCPCHWHQPLTYKQYHGPHTAQQEQGLAARLHSPINKSFSQFTNEEESKRHLTKNQNGWGRKEEVIDNISIIWPSNSVTPLPSSRSLTVGGRKMFDHNNRDAKPPKQQ